MENYECKDGELPTRAASPKVDPLRRHVGSSNYSKKKIQPWHIWDEYDLNPWDADIIKRILRTKAVEGQSATETRKEDYQKVIHICEFLISRLENRTDVR